MTTTRSLLCDAVTAALDLRGSAHRLNSRLLTRSSARACFALSVRWSVGRMT